MGISKVTGIAATTFLVTSVSLCKMGMRITMLPFLFTGSVAFVVTIASHNAINLPWILGKNSVGRFPLWSIVKIVEGLYLGGWPFLLKHLPPGSPLVIDCTCELPRSSFVPADEYLCLATWDTRAPAPYQIELAVRWACQKRSEGKPVYVHCAFGHGRSACVVCAILVALGAAETWKDAENIIRERRNIKMNALHRKTLEEWSKHRVSQKKGN
ncbi:unnamed protein product [Urochloa humidicola]